MRYDSGSNFRPYGRGFGVYSMYYSDPYVDSNRGLGRRMYGDGYSSYDSYYSLDSFGSQGSYSSYSLYNSRFHPRRFGRVYHPDFYY